MRILIIEDEQPAVKKLCMMLQDYHQDNQIVHVSDSVDDAKEFLQSHAHPDLIFLDIQLADGLSFEIFRDTSVQSPVIFTTAYDQFALQAFSLYCIDYLLKPISGKDLARALQKYERFKSVTLGSVISVASQTGMLVTSSTYKNRFLIRLGSRMFFVNTDDISYFYADEKAVYLVHIDGTKYPIDFSLEKLQQIVDPLRFFRVNRKVICSTQSIREIKTYINSRLKVTLSAGNNTDETIVSRERVQAFKEWAES